MFEWITGLLESGGAWAIFALMLLENIFPPIPSEVIMPLAGVNAAQQGGSVLGVIVAGTLGAMAGNIFWFVLAWKLGLDRFEGFLVRYGRISRGFSQRVCIN